MQAQRRDLTPALILSVGRADGAGVVLRLRAVGAPAQPRDEPPPARLRLRARGGRGALPRRLRRLLPPQGGHRQPLRGRRRQGADHQVRLLQEGNDPVDFRAAKASK